MKAIKLKYYNDYEYDEIFDMYNRTKDQRFLSYAFMKRNNLNIYDVTDFLQVDYENMFLFMFNIQQALDGRREAKNLDEMYKMINIKINLDDLNNEEDEF